MAITSEISEIIPKQLYLGSAAAAQDLDLLTSLGITHILNAAKTVKCYFPKKFTYHHLQLEDSAENLKDHLGEAIKFIEKGNIVFVHCLQGISRSASVVIAYLMRKNMWTYVSALNFVKEKREVIHPHFYFEQALCNQSYLLE